uniref:Uncharacterized protein n=1 Tax=Romanomermis culicivorax TaxID=13658 RepID=A0A915JYR9_ROMCU
IDENFRDKPLNPNLVNENKHLVIERASSGSIKTWMVFSRCFHQKGIHAPAQREKNLLRHHTKQHSQTGCLYCNGNFTDQKSLLVKKHCQQCLAVKPDQNAPMELEEKSEDYGQPI